MALGGIDRGVAVRDAISVLNCSTAVVSIVLSSAISDLIPMEESAAVSMALVGGAWVVTGGTAVAVLNCSTAEVMSNLRSLISVRSDKISRRIWWWWLLLWEVASCCLSKDFGQP